jgi:ATP-dependent DNA ligase
MAAVCSPKVADLWLPRAPLQPYLRKVNGARKARSQHALHSRQHEEEVQLCAFDLLSEGDDDLRKLPLHLRKASLERLLARRPEGVFVNPFERGEVGPDLFRAACNMDLEGLVSKRRDRPYQAGRSRHWLKVKNRSHPAMERVMESFG